MDNEQEEFEWDGPSKSERKRQMHALQQIGERLVALPQSQLDKMPISDDNLLEAIMLARRITARSGRRRQLQFIGKLMRTVDAEPLVEALAALDNRKQADAARFHQLEHLRDALLSEGDKALEQVTAVYPDADRAHIRQLLRNHQREIKAERPQSAAKSLFRYLRELDEQQESDFDSE